MKPSRYLDFDHLVATSNGLLCRQYTFSSMEEACRRILGYGCSDMRLVDGSDKVVVVRRYGDGEGFAFFADGCQHIPAWIVIAEFERILSRLGWRADRVYGEIDRFRQGPIRTCRWRWRSGSALKPRLGNERRANAALLDEDIAEHGVRARPARHVADDPFDGTRFNARDSNWKRYRRTRWK
jgi:hypothetical protein